MPQQRVMNKVLLAKKKRKQVENSREKITVRISFITSWCVELVCVQALQNQAASAAAEGQNQITAAMRKLREDLTRVEENMRSELARITAMNEGASPLTLCFVRFNALNYLCAAAALNPQLQLCDSVLADLDEGVFLAKVHALPCCLCLSNCQLRQTSWLWKRAQSTTSESIR